MITQVSYIVRSEKARSTWTICECLLDAQTAKAEAEHTNPNSKYKIVKREITDMEIE